MRFIWLFSLGLIIWTIDWAPALASSDYRHARSWTLVNRNLSAGSNLAMLQPGNDTRVNLLLLQDDRPGGAVSGQGRVFFEWSELSTALYPARFRNVSPGSHSHSRCQTFESGRDAFSEAVRSAKRLPRNEQDLLISVRESISPDCEDMAAGGAEIARLAPIRSQRGRDFGVYLTSALAFYNGDFDASTKGFSALVKAKDDWLKETALYMIARSELNRSQSRAFDNYGYFGGPGAVDQGAIRNAERGFNLYRKIYPQGSYHQSARGLLRRTYWLAGETEKLSNEYAAVLDNPRLVGIQLPVLVQEIDDKLLATLSLRRDTSDPELLAMIALYRMREPRNSYGDEVPKLAITRAEIESMRDSLSSRPGLLEYLLAAQAFYVANNPEMVLELIPDDAREPRTGYLDFSRQVLRGQALEAVGDRNVRGFWEQLLSGTDSIYQRGLVELALAMNLERNDAVDDVFARHSVIETPVLREIMLQYAAGPALLRKQAKNIKLDERERDLALYVLLYRQLTHGAYAEFLSDLNLVKAEANQDGPFFNSRTENNYGYEEALQPIPLGLFTQFDQSDEFDCPVLKKTVEILVSNADSHRGLLCLSDYVRLAGFDDYWMDIQPKSNQLGGSGLGFPDPVFSRLESYRQIIANPQASSENRAYALYRAVWCYGPAGINSCGGSGVDEPQRGVWFRELKRRYPSSLWAQKLKYYW